MTVPVNSTVTVRVAQPPAPAVLGDSYSTPFQTALTVPVADVLVNDTGTGITVTSIHKA